MKRTLGLLACTLSLSLPVGGCLFAPGHSHGTAGVHGAAPRCHPSQYWDGYQCRHKGQGRGARKHDGR